MPCSPGTTCPLGNPSTYNRTFALNGTLSPNLTLNAGDQLQFNLATTVPNHPLTICQNSIVPSFCMQATGSNLLNTPITQAGNNTSVTFVMVGTYYYGCMNHAGMGATITVTAAGHKVSASFLAIVTIALTTIFWAKTYALFIEFSFPTLISFSLSLFFF
jgi:hypothetical protein